ncbi:MAG: hypothetical protein RL318_2312, partial [Fibrobacterota bacterium]
MAEGFVGIFGPMSGWFRHPLFAWAYRWRGFLVSALGLGGAGLLWERRPDAPWWSLAPLSLGLGLRIWARTFIGRHTRGAVLAAPVRACGGPYRWFGHPLYLANVLVAIGCLGALGASVVATVGAALPVAFFYGILAMGESAFLR